MTIVASLLGGGLLWSGCHETAKPQRRLNEEMRDVYGQFHALFTYVWSPAIFTDPQNKQAIAGLLESLASGFHRVKGAAEADPGFAIAIQVSQSTLADVSRRFNEGKIDYASWRLRGLAQNCVACHTRYQVPLDFIGSMPAEPDASPDSTLATAEYLIASRQFDRAAERLFTLAEKSAGSGESYEVAFDALKLWLLIEVRVRGAYGPAAVKLKSLLAVKPFPEQEQRAVLTWIADLQELMKRPEPSDLIGEAADSIQSLKTDDTIAEKDNHLARILYATALLHKSLLKPLEADARRKATYLLAVAYYHLQIPQFEAFRELYLEQCIREFPKTQEARDAFALFDQEVRFRATGSGGTNLVPEDEDKLIELRKLAYGK